MKNTILVLLGVLAVGFLGLSMARAQDEEPSSDLPLYDTSATATVTAETGTVYTTVTATATRTATSTTTVNEISAEDEAETGAEVYILSALSLVAGTGVYFIKKYIDIKRYSI